MKNRISQHLEDDDIAELQAGLIKSESLAPLYGQQWSNDMDVAYWNGIQDERQRANERIAEQAHRCWDNGYRQCRIDAILLGALAFLGWAIWRLLT